MTQSNTNNYILLTIVAIVAVVAMVYLMRPEEPSTRLGNAIEDMAEGVEDAAEELDPNRTTGEKIGDAVEDMGDSIENSTD